MVAKKLLAWLIRKLQDNRFFGMVGPRTIQQVLAFI